MIETVTQDLDKNNMCLDSYHLSPLLDVGVGSMINQLIFGFRFIGERRQQFFKLKELMNEQIQLMSDPATATVLSMPWLRHFPIFSSYYNVFKDSVASLDSFFKG
uniref:Cytochrome P450 n=1 Tax=Ditylenchus dipsaci TaxID=166011 RepID=A0A915EPA0_9BILA